ncbi:MAG: hypothetical protein Q9164_006357, partial [Protoblastenia rupestris]
MAPIALDQQLAFDSALISTLSTSPHEFLQPSAELIAASLAQIKFHLNPLAAATSSAQEQRQQAARRKRKRGQPHSVDDEKPLTLKRVYLEGFDTDQVWRQASRILDATRGEIERSLPTVLPTTNGHKDEKPAVRFKEDEGADVELTSGEISVVDDEEEGSVVDKDVRDLEDPEIDDLDDLALAGGEEEGGELDEDHKMGNVLDGEDQIALSDEAEESPEVFVPDKLGLNDGFFSIDDFNRQSEFLEQQDVRGEEGGAASDEEDVDWDANPLVEGASQKANGIPAEAEDNEDSPEEDGPTFGNADLNAPDFSNSDDASDAGIQMEDLSTTQNTNDIKYADFFAPPPRKLTSSTHPRALPKTQPPPSSTNPQAKPSEEDIQRTISSVRRDIFEDDLTGSESDASAPSNPSDRRSTHQKRRAKLTEEIRRLEAAAVAKRPWTLSGEARAADRPINSLLEEDLEFERAGKPIPVITQEVSEDIEALIKRRILARDFDEIIRRRPGDLATGKDGPRRGHFELEDKKAQQSLAEIYETEHLKTTDPEAFIDKRDEKLKAEHAKMETLWKDISAKLDMLSNLHFRPKPPQASIHVVADVPTITMEDARPNAGGDVAGESMLAPQEIYKAGEGRDKKAD